MSFPKSLLVIYYLKWYGAEVIFLFYKILVIIQTSEFTLNYAYRYCGIEKPPVIRSKEITMLFITDNSVEKSGFSAIYTFINETEGMKFTLYFWF